MMSALKSLIALIIISFLVFNAAAAQTMVVDTGVPDGFEQLSAPRPTDVTVYYGGDVLGSFQAHFMPGAVQFDNPDDIIKAIPNLTSTDAIKTLLQQPLPAHADQMCTAKRTTDCGALSPDVIGVIFDEANLRAEIFVNKNFLSIVDKDADVYLPLPKRQLGSVYSFNGAANGTDANKPNFTLTNEAIHSFGEMKVMTQSTAANQGLRFDTVAGSIDRKGYNATTGLFRSRAMDLIGDRDMAGVSVSTSRRTIVDKHKSEGSDIILYLARRSFISIYREGRLYSSRAYDAGNQQIDTSELPEGAYPITLRIQESDGTIRDEKRFFVKAQELPPPGRPIYYAQAGVTRLPAEADSTIPQLTSDPIVRAGTVRRVTDNIGISAGVLGLKDRAMVETGSFLVTGESRLTASVMTSTHGDMGFHAGYQKTMKKVNVAVDVREYWSGDKSVDDMGSMDTSMDSLDMAEDATQGTAIINYMVNQDVTAGVRSSYSDQTGMPKAISVGPYAEWRIWQKQENMLAMNVNVARTQEHNEGSILFTFTRRFGKYGMNTTIGTGTGGDSKGPVGNTRVWHDNQDANNNVILGGGVTADQDNRIVSGDADWRNNFGRVRGNVQESFGQDGSSFGYGGNFSFNAAQTLDEFHVGGSQNDQSAVIIDTKGDNTSKMRVMVNDVPRGSFTVGKKQVVYLSPYHTYRIRVVPENAEFLEYDSSDRKVTVYPGNVVKMSWDVNTFYVIAARVMDTNNLPLANAILQDGRDQVTTNDKGYLQAELPMKQTLHFVKADQTPCTVTLPNDVQPDKGLLIYKNPLVCQPDAEGMN